jgi:hypothetical protein
MADDLQQIALSPSVNLGLSRVKHSAFTARTLDFLIGTLADNWEQILSAEKLGASSLGALEIQYTAMTVNPRNGT